MLLAAEEEVGIEDYFSELCLKTKANDWNTETLFPKNLFGDKVLVALRDVAKDTSIFIDGNEISGLKGHAKIIRSVSLDLNLWRGIAARLSVRASLACTN